MRWRSILAALAAAAAGGALGCGSPTRDPLARSLVPPVDASADAGDAGPLPDAGPDAAGLGKPCTDDAQCDDGVKCTFDVCDPVLRRCRIVPDDSLCDDGAYCNGREICVAFHGCEGGPVVTCDDGDPCTIDSCAEPTKACAHVERDQDVDGDPDAHCKANRDCDDLDPTVASTHSEVCANHKDDNCNDLVDETPCATPGASTCATALAIGAPGTYPLDTTGSPFTYPTSCSVTTPTSAHQVVAAITIPAGGPQDLEVWATASQGEAAVAIEAKCGDATSGVACGAGGGASTVRARGRSLAPGTYAVIVTTQLETPVELAVDFLAPTSPPTNESCAAPLPITPGTPIALSLIDPPPASFTSACSASIGPLTYALTLAQASDVRVYASTTRGNGQPIVGLRNAHCTALTDELRCRASASQPLFARGLAAGTYVITVTSTAPIDASLLVQVSAATAPPAIQTCATAPALAPNARVGVDLSNEEDAIKDGCFPGGPDAAFALTLANPSDVLVVGRFPQTEAGSVALDAATCDPPSVQACTVSGTPARASKRALPAGDWRVVLTDQNGAKDDTVVAYVRDTVAPTRVPGADTCAAAIAIPASGGFFTGDTSTATADWDDSCDAPGAAGGAPDQVLQLTLAQPQHVVFDMSGSTYTTILDVREGATCPGTEAPARCYVGFSANRSFLDVPLLAGTYWVVVDGYAGAKGAWNLDVRVLPP